MDIDLGDPLRWRDSLPARQPASSEVAAGAVAGLTGGLVAWGVAMVLLPEGTGGLRLLRLVAATLFGPFAVAPENVGLPALSVPGFGGSSGRDDSVPVFGSKFAGKYAIASVDPGGRCGSWSRQ